MKSGAVGKGKRAKPPTCFTKRTSRVVRAQSSVSHVCSGSMTPSTRRRRGLRKSTPAMNANKPPTEGRRKGEGRIRPGSHPNQRKKGEERKRTEEGRRKGGKEKQKQGQEQSQKQASSAPTRGELLTK